MPQLPHAGRAVTRRGFSLVEVMVAILALTMISIGLYGAFSFGFATVQIAQEDRLHQRAFHQSKR